METADFQGSLEAFIGKAKGIGKIDQARIRERPLLHIAASLGRTDIIEYMVDERGASTRTLDGKGRSAMHAALRSNQFGVARELLVRSAPLNMRDSNGETVLHLLATSADKSGSLLMHDISRFMPAEQIFEIFDLKRKPDDMTAHDLAKTNNSVHVQLELERVRAAKARFEATRSDDEPRDPQTLLMAMSMSSSMLLRSDSATSDVAMDDPLADDEFVPVSTVDALNAMNDPAMDAISCMSEDDSSSVSYGSRAYKNAREVVRNESFLGRLMVLFLSAKLRYVELERALVAAHSYVRLPQMYKLFTRLYSENCQLFNDPSRLDQLCFGLSVWVRVVSPNLFEPSFLEHIREMAVTMSDNNTRVLVDNVFMHHRSQTLLTLWGLPLSDTNEMSAEFSDTDSADSYSSSSSSFLADTSDEFFSGSVSGSGLLPMKSTCKVLSSLMLHITCNIEPKELQGILKSDRDEKLAAAPNLGYLNDLYNRISNWTSRQVLTARGGAGTVEAIRYFIGLAELFEKTNNLLAVAAVTGGLSRSAVSGLSFAWAAIDPDTRGLYERLCALVSPLKSFRIYRDKIAELCNAELVTPYVPFVAVTMRKVVRACEMFKPWAEGDEPVINTEYVDAFYDAYSEMRAPVSEFDGNVMNFTYSEFKLLYVLRGALTSVMAEEEMERLGNRLSKQNSSLGPPSTDSGRNRKMSSSAGKKKSTGSLGASKGKEKKEKSKRRSSAAADSPLRKSSKGNLSTLRPPTVFNLIAFENEGLFSINRLRQLVLPWHAQILAFNMMSVPGSWSARRMPHFLAVQYYGAGFYECVQKKSPTDLGVLTEQIYNRGMAMATGIQEDSPPRGAVPAWRISFVLNLASHYKDLTAAILTASFCAGWISCKNKEPVSVFLTSAPDMPGYAAVFGPADFMAQQYSSATRGVLVQGVRPEMTSELVNSGVVVKASGASMTVISGGDMCLTPWSVSSAGRSADGSLSARSHTSGSRDAGSSMTSREHSMMALSSIAPSPDQVLRPAAIFTTPLEFQKPSNDAEPGYFGARDQETYSLMSGISLGHGVEAVLSSLGVTGIRLTKARMSSSYMFGEDIGQAAVVLAHAKSPFPFSLVPLMAELTSLASAFGFGNLELLTNLSEGMSLDEDLFSLVFSLKHSCEATSWTTSRLESTGPVCAIACGFVAGFIEMSLAPVLKDRSGWKGRVACAEFACKAGGGVRSDCRLLVAPFSTVASLVAEQGK